MDELVGQHDVRVRVQVALHPEVLLVVAREPNANTVVRVQHGGNAIEAETVETELGNPVLHVGEEEPGYSLFEKMR